MSNPLESLVWVRFSFKLNKNLLKSPVINEVIVVSLFELNGFVSKTIISPCSNSKLYEGIKTIRVGYLENHKICFIKKWEANLPPRKLIDNLTDTTFVVEVNYFLKRDKKKRKLQSDVYHIKVKVHEEGIEFHVRHVAGLMRMSFEEIFTMFKAIFIKNLKISTRRARGH